MKAFIAIFVSILAINVTVGADIAQVLAKDLHIAEAEVQKCLKENNLEDLDMAQIEAALLEKALSNEDLDEFLINYGCVITCVSEKAGLIQDGEISLDEMVKLAINHNYPMNDDMKEKLSKCIDTVKEQDDKCKMGISLTMCFAQIVASSGGN